MAEINYTCVDRFLKYVTYDTQSSETSDTYPSTENQRFFGRELVRDLKDLGSSDASMDEWGYVTATLPSTVDHKVPVIGLIAHMDTSPDVSGKDVKPIIHRNYQGGDIILPSGVEIKASDNRDLVKQIGNDIITSDGHTLLGADNKSGIAEIFDAIAHLLAHPEIPHGIIHIAVTPDEEIGRGTEHFNIKKFGAEYAYTIDGEALGEIEDETFCADSVTITVKGVNVHPGYAKGKLINAIKIASEIIGLLPKDKLSPETTEKREGYMHANKVSGGVEETILKFLIRDFTLEGLHKHENLLNEIVTKIGQKYPRASIDFKVEESYRNMKYEIDKDPKVVEYAMDAVRRAGIEPVKNIIRGGTDGARLSYQGLLTPNIFTGGHNFHSRQEWISIQDMQKAVDVIVQLAQIWEEKNR